MENPLQLNLTDMGRLDSDGGLLLSEPANHYQIMARARLTLPFQSCGPRRGWQVQRPLRIRSIPPTVQAERAQKKPLEAPVGIRAGCLDLQAAFAVRCVS